MSYLIVIPQQLRELEREPLGFHLQLESCKV